jgi:hypothetical protein
MHYLPITGLIFVRLLPPLGPFGPSSPCEPCSGKMKNFHFTEHKGGSQTMDISKPTETTIRIFSLTYMIKIQTYTL